MKPINFSKYTQILRGQQMDDLPALTTNYEGYGPAIISCWHLSFCEWLKLLFNRRVYLTVVGTHHPPVLLTTDPDEIGVAQAETLWRKQDEEFLLEIESRIL